MKEPRDQSEAGREPRNKTITIKRDPSNGAEKGGARRGGGEGRGRRVDGRGGRLLKGAHMGVSGGSGERWRDGRWERSGWRSSAGRENRLQKGDVVDTFCPNYDVNAKLKS